ncbi:MAG: helix-turn-helix transcriptional regulator [Lachnospiraceae bacterium]|nr:helix-turn-helix transcriptional regulator [Lachnospiraceae bacterium]
MTIDENKQYIRDRITALRMKKGVSEYEMSKALGKSSCYIQGISSGKALPSMDSFLCICEYLEISVRDFFDMEEKEPVLFARLLRLARQLSPAHLSLLVRIGEVMLEEESYDFGQIHSGQKNLL